MATGYSQEWSKSQSEIGYGYIRLYYSTSYNPQTNKSTITLTPQIKSNVTLGEIRFYDATGTGNGGVYGNSSKLYSLATSYGGNSNLYAYDVSTSYKNMSTTSGSISTFTVSHDANGDASFTLGLYGSIKSYIYGYSGSNWGRITPIGAIAGKFIPLHEDAPYAITYNANSGSGAPSSQSVYAGVSYTLSSQVPTKTGYNFIEWNTNVDGTGISYAAGQQNVKPNGNLILYAQWSRNSYTLTVEPNNSNLGTVSPTTALIDYANSVTLTATPISIIGYITTFLNWSINEGGTGYFNDATLNPTIYSIGAGNTTVTANFTRTENNYTIIFNGNGAAGGLTPNQTLLYTEQATLNNNQFIPVTNYRFKYWNTKADGTGESYSNMQTVQSLAPSGNFNLYAIWELTGNYITYNSNGIGIAPTSQYKVADSSVVLSNYISDQTSTPSIENYIITCNANGGVWTGDNGTASKSSYYRYIQNIWNTSSDGEGINYQGGATYSENADLSLWAIWNSSIITDYTYDLPANEPFKPVSATVIYNANGGTFASGVATSTTVSCNYTFDGWWTEPSGGIKRDSTSQVSAEETVYAHYDVVNFPLVETLPKTSCSKGIYSLMGWSLSSSDVAPQFSPAANFQPSAPGETTLYAVWGKTGEVYIGEDKYKILIYNGESWGQYQAWIYNGSDWLPY